MPMELYNESVVVSSTFDSTDNCSDDFFTSASLSSSSGGELVNNVAVDDNNEVLLRSIESRWRDNQLHTSLIIDRVVTPVWYVVGIVGNMVSARIWLGRGMRRNNSSAIYLATLSINDTLFLFLHVWQELKYAWSQRTVDYPVVCELFALVYLVTQYLAPTLVLGFTVERFIAICYPYQVCHDALTPRPLDRQTTMTESGTEKNRETCRV